MQLAKSIGSLKAPSLLNSLGRMTMGKSKLQVQRSRISQNETDTTTLFSQEYNGLGVLH